MEKEFWNDMDNLAILRPTIVTRVTEYIEEMKQYIEKIEQNGFAYTVNNSVYMNSDKFKENNYPWNLFNKSSTNDYTECDFSIEKTNINDFALWKAAKPNSISFPSNEVKEQWDGILLKIK